MMLEPGEEYTATLTRDGVGDIHGGKLQEDFNEYQQIVADANTASRTLQKKVEEAAAKKHFKTTKELEDKVDKVQENAFAKMNALIRKNADNVFAAYLQTAGSERIMELKPKVLLLSACRWTNVRYPGCRLSRRTVCSGHMSLR